MFSKVKKAVLMLMSFTLIFAVTAVPAFAGTSDSKTTSSIGKYGKTNTITYSIKAVDTIKDYAQATLTSANSVDMKVECMIVNQDGSINEAPDVFSVKASKTSVATTKNSKGSGGYATYSTKSTDWGNFSNELFCSFN